MHSLSTPAISAATLTMTTSTPLDRLATLVQSLPRELFDEIFDLTFTLPKDLVTLIDKHHKEPSILQVDSATRKQVTAQYYATRFECTDHNLLAQWLGLLPPKIELPNIWLDIHARAQEQTESVYRDEIFGLKIDAQLSLLEQGWTLLAEWGELQSKEETGMCQIHLNMRNLNVSL